MTDRDQQRQNLIQKHTGKAGLRGRIDAKCIECIFDPYQPGSWLKQVDLCTCTECPLYPVRKKPKGRVS